jgi:hypothetical protein
MPAAGVSAPASKLTTERAKPPVTGIAPGDGSGDIGGTKADQLLVGVDALALLGGERLGDRDGFDKANDRDQKRRAKAEVPRRSGREGGQGQRRQALRNGAHDLRTPCPSSPRLQTASGRDHHGQHGAGLGDHVSRTGAQPHARRKSGFSPLRTQNRKPVAPAPMARVIGFTWHCHVFGQTHVIISGSVSPPAPIPRMCFSWLVAISMPRSRDEARDDRMRQEVGQKPQPQHPHGQQNRARQAPPASARPRA